MVAGMDILSFRWGGVPALLLVVALNGVETSKISAFSANYSAIQDFALVSYEQNSNWGNSWGKGKLITPSALRGPTHYTGRWSGHHHPVPPQLLPCPLRCCTHTHTHTHSLYSLSQRARPQPRTHPAPGGAGRDRGHGRGCQPNAGDPGPPVACAHN